MCNIISNVNRTISSCSNTGLQVEFSRKLSISRLSEVFAITKRLYIYSIDASRVIFGNIAGYSRGFRLIFLINTRYSHKFADSNTTILLRQQLETRVLSLPCLGTTFATCSESYLRGRTQPAQPL